MSLNMLFENVLCFNHAVSHYLSRVSVSGLLTVRPALGPSCLRGVRTLPQVRRRPPPPAGGRLAASPASGLTFHVGGEALPASGPGPDGSPVPRGMKRPYRCRGHRAASPPGRQRPARVPPASAMSGLLGAQPAASANHAAGPSGSAVV